MKMYIYTLKDTKLSVYSRPIFSQYDKQTMLELNNRAIKNNDFSQELEDKELYFLGTYHDTTAELKPEEKEYLLSFPKLERKETKKDENKK